MSNERFKPGTEAALKQWIGARTWDSGHPADTRRFYEFVNQYYLDHGHVIDERGLRAKIKDLLRMNGYPTVAYQEKLIQNRILLASKILEFLEVTRR